MEGEDSYLVCGFSGGIPGSKQIACTDCGREMFVAPSGQQHLLSDPSLIPLCLFCANRRISEDNDAKIVPPTKAQEAELFRFGVTPEALQEVYDRLGITTDEGKEDT